MKKLSRTQKAMLNTTTAGLQEVVQLICGLILPRLVLRTFGSSYSGITSSAKQFLSAVSILTVGIAGSTRVALYQALKDRDISKAGRLVKATEKYMRKVGLVLLAGLAVLTIVYPLVVDTGYSWIEVAPLVIAAGISASGRYFFGTASNALLAADQSVYISNILSMLANILNVLLSIFFIRQGCNIQTVKLVSSLILLANPLVRSICVKRMYHLDRHCEADKSALSLRREVMAHSIANIVHDHTDIVVLTLFCNIKIVSVYTVYNLVMNVLKRTQRVFTTGIEAVFGNMWVKGELEKIRKGLGTFELIVSMAVSTLFATTLVMILPFIGLYTKGVTDVEYILPSYAFVITIAQMFFCFRTPYLTLAHAIGHYEQTKKGAYLEAGINLVVSVVLVQFMGIVGVAVGTLVANIFRTVQYGLYIDKTVISRGKTVFMRRILWAMCNAGILCLLTYSKVAEYGGKNWGSWIICAVIVTLISFVITFISTLLFYRSDLKGVIQLIRNGGLKKRRKRG